VIVAPRIRKSASALTKDDLVSHPVWEFAGDEEGIEGQDETTVRPYLGALPAERAYGLLSRADFTSADGRHHIGYVDASPGEGEDIEASLPVIVCDAGQVGFWYGAIIPSELELSENHSKLGSTDNQLFPVKYRSSDGALTEPIEGVITAFMHMR
jgi:hypothetical protein